MGSTGAATEEGSAIGLSGSLCEVFAVDVLSGGKLMFDSFWSAPKSPIAHAFDVSGIVAGSFESAGSNDGVEASLDTSFGGALDAGISTLTPQRGQIPRFPARKFLTFNLCPFGQRNLIPILLLVKSLRRKRHCFRVSCLSPIQGAIVRYAVFVRDTILGSTIILMWVVIVKLAGGRLHGVCLAKIPGKDSLFPEFLAITTITS